jgi:hypothetical protein
MDSMMCAVLETMVFGGVVVVVETDGMKRIHSHCHVGGRINSALLVTTRVITVYGIVAEVIDVGAVG